MSGQDLRLVAWAALLCAAFSSSAFARPSVAIIDSGVAPLEELKGVLKAEYDFAASPPRPDFAPSENHGTMVATILNREAKGAIDIVSFRIDDPNGCTAGKNPPCQRSAAPIVKAIDKATELGVDAINMSLSLADNPDIVAAVGRATAKGVLVVMAAGNAGHDHPDNLRMARIGYPLTLLVGAVDDKGQHWDMSNRPEETVEGYNYVWQFGVAVPTQLRDGTQVHGTGTSFAVPIETARRVLARDAERAAKAATQTAEAHGIRRPS